MQALQRAWRPLVHRSDSRLGPLFEDWLLWRRGHGLKSSPASLAALACWWSVLCAESWPFRILKLCQEGRRYLRAGHENRSGKQADYIPPLAQADPERFGVAIVTVDGQVYQMGDAAVDFSIQSMCKPLNYCFALEELGRISSTAMWEMNPLVVPLITILWKDCSITVQENRVSR